MSQGSLLRQGHHFQRRVCEFWVQPNIGRRQHHNLLILSGCLKSNLFTNPKTNLDLRLIFLVFNQNQPTTCVLDVDFSRTSGLIDPPCLSRPSVPRSASCAPLFRRGVPAWERGGRAASWASESDEKQRAWGAGGGKGGGREGRVGGREGGWKGDGREGGGSPNKALTAQEEQMCAPPRSLPSPT